MWSMSAVGNPAKAQIRTNPSAAEVAPMSVPHGVKYAIIGAGIHGLSTAFHLAQMLKATGRGSGADILVVDKTAVAAGASGIACGVVRNNYFQPAMRELMAHSVEVWESDAKAYSYHPVGYMQISPEAMRKDVCLDLRAAAGDRLRVGVRRGRRRLDAIHERPVRRLAGARHHLGAAREARWLCQQSGEHAWPCRQGHGRGRAASCPASK